MFLVTRYLRYTLTAIAIIALSFAMVTTSDANIDEKTIAGMWTFEEGKGKEVKDLSGNGTDGEFVGDLKWAKGNSAADWSLTARIPGSNSVLRVKIKRWQPWISRNLKAFPYTLGSMQQSHRLANVSYGKDSDVQRGRSFYSERVRTRTAKIIPTPRFTSESQTAVRNLKSSAMKFQIKSGCTSLVHGMDRSFMSMLTVSYKTAKMRKDRRGHPLKKSTSAQILAVVNAVSGTALLMKLLSSTWHSPMTKLQNSVRGLKAR